MLGYFVELMKELEEADKVHVLDILANASIELAQLAIISYLQIGIGYNFFCEEPLCDQSNHTTCT